MSFFNAFFFSQVRCSFIGFTCHVYDPETNSIKSFRLALRPFNSSHTAENILEMSSEIFQEFGIKHKVSFTCPYYTFIV